MILDQKKMLIKRSVDPLEKLAVGSFPVGFFKNVPAGIYVSLECMTVSYIPTYWEAKL